MYRGQNRPRSATSMPSKAIFRAPTGLFRRFQGEVRRIPLPGTGVKLAPAAAHFHGFGVARQGPWVTWVNSESVRQYRSPPSTSWFKVYTRVCLHRAHMPTEEVNDAQVGKEEQKLSAEVLDKFAELITFALGLVAALAWNEAISSCLPSCWVRREEPWPPSSSTLS